MLPRKATRGIFVHLKNHTLSLSFFPISGRKHFGELGDKTPQSHHIFFLSSFQPNTSFFSILPKIHSTKHTLRENCTHEGPQLAWILGSWMLEQYMPLKYLNFKVYVIILTLVFVWFGYGKVWDRKKIYFFPLVFLARVERWKDNLFYLVKKKMRGQKMVFVKFTFISLLH